MGRRMEATTSHAFGGLLRRFRLGAGLTQEELAERAGLSPRGISDLERGVNRAPYRTTVERLIDALGLDEAAAEALRAKSSRRRGPVKKESKPRRRLAVPLTSILGREREEAE